MGTWGVDTFENDDGCDFAADVAESSNLSKLEKAFDRINSAGDDFIEAPNACEALAAAEIIARLAGRGGARTAYTEKIDTWVAKIKIIPSADLLDKARRSLMRIKTDPSELLGL